MKFWFILFLIFLSFSCRKFIESELVLPKPSIAQKDSVAISWLALGDSYTIGQGVNQSERYPSQALELLKVKFIQTKRLTYLAQTGWTSADLLTSMSEQNLQGHNFVSLLIGVNDQYQGIDTSIYRKNFTNILNRSIELAGGDQRRVFVLSIPDYSLTPIGRQLDTLKIRKEIDWFNVINKQIALQNKCIYLDITELGRAAKNYPNWVAQDGLHPSGLAYSKWAELIYTNYLMY
ncbi:SGNH/GDSL hydrolase family protein [Aquirufa ecclesiirivi]|uniref:SGNH/GDSL hydrolase family protein n=1 Tax=Aquirufa ecclesiirivi TaxID=2715124 RepID=A0ABT4JI35_9BACT|nr:GDSL-type esterase/lipase family protein [Aquirufa ecclesiirivi]MCZ2475925.1 SGNH/GDSL hydrolase family protein [Aquirufa ecclesiirivi]